jgi:hypothetical protein
MSKLKTMVSNPGVAVNHAQRRIGKVAFGIDRPFSQHAAGKLAIKKSQLQSNGVENGTRSGVEYLQREGALDLGQIYDDELIDATAETFDRLLKNHGATYTRGYDGEDYTYGVSSADIDLKEHFPRIEEFINEAVTETLEGYYRSHFKPVRANIWRNHHVPPEVVSEAEVFSNYWHFDPHTTDHMKLFVYLTDVVDEDDGPFHYITRGESEKIASDSYYRKRDGIPNGKVEDEASVQLFTGPRGSTAFCNTTTNLHRAGIPAEGHQRDLLQIVFAPASEPLQENWSEDEQMYSHPGPHHNGFKRLLNY